MEIIQDNTNLTKKTISCIHCQSILLVDKQDINIIQMDNGRFCEWNEYQFTCPCCNHSNLLKNNPFYEDRRIL